MTNEEYMMYLHKMGKAYKRQLEQHNRDYQKMNRIIYTAIGIGFTSCLGVLTPVTYMI